MADNIDHPEPDFENAERLLPPTDELAADAVEEFPSVEKLPRPEPAGPSAGAAAPRRPVPEPASRPARERPAIVPIVAAVLLGNVILFLAGVLSGWILARKDVLPSLPTASSAPAPAATNTSLAEVTRSMADKASKADIGSLKSELQTLGAQIKEVKSQLAHDSAQVQSQLEAAAKPNAAPPPDLKPIEARIDRLAESTKSLNPVPGELHALRDRFANLEKGLDSVRAEVSALPKQIKEAMTPPPSTASTKPARSEPDPVGEAIAKSAGLFKEGQFAQARDLLLKTTQNKPNDARLWYNAALANGLATNNWGSETVMLVQRGLECERAGTPSRAEIDAFVNELPPEQGREWLREWRARLTPR